MTGAIILLISVVVLGVAIGVPAYVKLLRILRERHGDLWNELGQPTLMMGSPSRSLKVQKFLYSKRAFGIDDLELQRSVKFLQVFTVVLVVAVFASIVLLLLATLQMLNQGGL